MTTGSQYADEGNNAASEGNVGSTAAGGNSASGGVDAERLLAELGQLNSFHRRCFFMLALVTFAAAHYAINYVFLAADVDYRCMVPECDSPTTSFSSTPLWLTRVQKPLTSRERKCTRRALRPITNPQLAVQPIRRLARAAQVEPLGGPSPSLAQPIGGPQASLVEPLEGFPATPLEPVEDVNASLIKPLDEPLGPSYVPHQCDGVDFAPELLACDRWLYASNDTIVGEFNLACQDWKRTLVGTVHNIGMLVSLPIFGYISDRWGRKRALVLSCTLVGAIGSLKAFSVSYEMYVIVEFLETVAGASAFPAAYILTIELLGQDKRVLTTAFLGIMLVLGGLSFALLARTFRYWRTFILVAYPPSLLFVSYVFLLPESIRWLLSNGRKEEAVEIIMKAAKMNKVTLSEETMRQLTEEKVKPLEQTAGSEEPQGLWMQVLRSPVIMRRLAICSWWWITCTFVFYGMAINSVALAGDKYANYALVVSVEVVAVVGNALLLDRVGRKRTLLAAYVVCGIALVAITFVPATMAWLATLLYLLGKIAITQAFSGVYMYTSELFPTHARHSLLGFCSMVGRIGSIVAPQMPLLAIYVEWLPSALFGSAALIAGGLMLTTPETLHARLPDTIQEAEQLARRPPKPPKPETVTMTITVPASDMMSRC